MREHDRRLTCEEVTNEDACEEQRVLLRTVEALKIILDRHITRHKTIRLMLTMADTTVPCNRYVTAKLPDFRIHVAGPYSFRPWCRLLDTDKIADLCKYLNGTIENWETTQERLDMHGKWLEASSTLHDSAAARLSVISSKLAQPGHDPVPMDYEGMHPGGAGAVDHSRPALRSAVTSRGAPLSTILNFASIEGTVPT